MEALEGHWVMLATIVALLAAAAAVFIWTRVRWNGSAQSEGTGQPPHPNPAPDDSSDDAEAELGAPANEARPPTRPESDDTVAAAWNDTATQFSGHRTDGESADLVIGLDFGTSCTKVIVRSPYMARSRAIAVPWRDDSGGNAYLLPTVLYRNARSELDLPPTGDVAGERFTDIKTALMDRADNEQARAVAAAYLGVTLRTARQWLLNTQADIYGQYFIRWALNLGIPSAGYDDEQVRAAFGVVGRAAWELSLDPKAPTLETAIRACRRAEVDRNPDADTRIDVVPEIVAEVVGYARSKRRRNGLHVVMDIGASTLDICGFILHAPEGDDHYELLTALVERLGLNELHLKRVAAIRQAGARQGSRAPITALDPSSPIPVRGSDYVEGSSNALHKKLTAVDDNYVLECTNALMQVLMTLKKDMDPFAEAWKSGLPVFLAGGGRDFKLIGRATERADKRLTQSVTVDGIRCRRLPALETLANEDAPDGRLDVAYGLSFDRFDVGEIHRPGSIPPVPPKPAKPKPDYPSKDVAQ